MKFATVPGASFSFYSAVYFPKLVSKCAYSPGFNLAPVSVAGLSAGFVSAFGAALSALDADAGAALGASLGASFVTSAAGAAGGSGTGGGSGAGCAAGGVASAGSALSVVVLLEHAARPASSAIAIHFFIDSAPLGERVEDSTTQQRIAAVS